MDIDATYWILSFIFSFFGLIYFNYGRKQQKISVLLCGLTLMIYPYFLDSWISLSIVGAILLITPKFVRF